MKKILVTTDFSTHSKAGIRFALNWASKASLELVFFHVIHVKRKLSMNEATYRAHVITMKKEFAEKLKKFVANLYAKNTVDAKTHSFVVEDGFDAHVSIMEYCSKHHIDCICISTRGAGTLNKIFGTTTGNLITKSEVPVIAVPKNYRVGKLDKVLYASDMTDLSRETRELKTFCDPIKAMVEILHFSWPYEFDIDREKLEGDLTKKFPNGFKLVLKSHDIERSFIKNLLKEIEKVHPSVVVMFTEQERTLWQKLFLQSRAENLSFNIKVPLLVFKKT